MEHNNAAETTPSKQPPNKQPQKIPTWVLVGSILLLSALCLVQAILGFVMTQKRFGPPKSERLQGTIVIRDEHGTVLPYRETTFTLYSRFAEYVCRTEVHRKRNLYIDEEGFGNQVPIAISKSPATLFFHTWNGKYAAVIDIGEGEPTTGLVVTLHPRHSATGRLVQRSGTPLANYEFRLLFERSPGPGKVEVLEFVYGETDASGYFTVDRLIPGLEYRLRTHLPKEDGGSARVTMPMLQPEQYQEPFDLGNVFITPDVAFSPTAHGVQVAVP